MGCLPSKQQDDTEQPFPVKKIVHISWPTKSYRNPGVLPSTLEIFNDSGTDINNNARIYYNPFQNIPKGYPNTPPPFPIPEATAVGPQKIGLIYCEELDRSPRPLTRHARSRSSMEAEF